MRMRRYLSAFCTAYISPLKLQGPQRQIFTPTVSYTHRSAALSALHSYSSSRMSSTQQKPYDPDNVFAKILDGRLPCHKVS